MTDPDALFKAIRAGWSARSASDASLWSAANPSTGQCAVTALIVQDELGGELIRATVNGVSHYYNRLPDGSEIDLTREQFGSPQVWGAVIRRDRSYVLGAPDTARRYLLLRDSVSRALTRQGISSRPGFTNTGP